MKVLEGRRRGRRFLGGLRRLLRAAARARSERGDGQDRDRSSRIHASVRQHTEWRISSGAVTVAAPGPWLRLTAFAASAATLLAVVSGAFGLGAAHRLLAALALPPLVALLVSAWLSHRRLLPAAVTAFGLFGAAALLTAEVVHVTV